MAEETVSSMERLMQQVAALGTDPEPVDVCTSAERFTLEIEKIYKKCWLNVGRSDDLPKAGDFFTRKLPFLNDVPIIVVRGEDGVVRSFYDVCRHRGTVVEKRECGKAKGFMCDFHGWTYDTKGRLTAVPHEQLYFGGLNKNELGLLPIATETWADGIFINLDPKPKETLLEYLDEIPNVFREYPFTTLKRTGRWSATVKANWKIWVDSFQDALHAEILHRRSLPDLFPVTKMLSDAASFATGLNLTGRHSYSAGGISTGDHVVTPTEGLALRWRRAGVTVPGPTSEGPTRGKSPGGTIKCFPNFIWAFFGDRYMFTHRFLPVSVNETYWEFETYMEPPTNAGEKISQELSNVLSRDAVREDISTLESMQRAFTAGIATHNIMAAIDATIRYNYRVIESYLETGGPLEKESIQ